METLLDGLQAQGPGCGDQGELTYIPRAISSSLK